jgi:ABC-type bacteriocin/lantibiotic exporter with double-glycine peptidase domain
LKQFLQQIRAILTRAEKARISTLILLDLLFGALDIAFLVGVFVIINYYTSGSNKSHFFTSYLHQTHNPLLFISLFFILFGIKNWLGYLVSSSENTFFFEVASRLSRQNITAYLHGDHKQFVHTDSSIYTRKISHQPIEFSTYVLTNMQQVIIQSILIFFTSVAILFYHPVLFLLLFAILGPPVLVLGHIIKKRLGSVRLGIKSDSQKAIQHLNEALAGFVESNIYNRHDLFINRYHQHQKHLNENIATQQSLQKLPTRLIEIFAILGLFILILISILSGRPETASILNIGIFMAAAYKIIPGMVKIMNSIGQIKTYRFVIDDLAKPQKYHHESHSTKPLRSVEFKNVSYGYDHHPEVINGLSFKIHPGDMIGISGDSGIGKTTVLNLLLGFLHEAEGDICFNGKKTSFTGRRQYFGNISYLKQQPFFINDTIFKNITLSDDVFNSSRLVDAMAISGVDKLIAQYPDGIYKQVTENGKNISGGQRQRIMLARALYHEFELLILDEPFSELDEFAEKEILQRLCSLISLGKMILLITHNKESLAYCNKIISFDEVYEA